VKVIVIGPNLPRPLCDKGTMHVHKEGCADMQRGQLRHAVSADQGGWAIDVDSVAEIIEACYPSSDFCYDPTVWAEYEGYRSDVHIAPCVTLPEKIEAA